MSSRLLPLLITMLLILPGCHRAQDPVITLTNSTWGTTTEQAATVDLMVRLQNPNNQPLHLVEFVYEVDVDGREVYDGTRSAEMTLASKSTRDIILPAVIPFDRIGWSAGALPPSAQVRIHGTLRYLLPGAIAQTLFDTGMRRPRASFQGEGEVSVTILPPTTGPATAPATAAATAPAPAQ